MWIVKDEAVVVWGWHWYVAQQASGRAKKRAGGRAGAGAPGGRHRVIVYAPPAIDPRLLDERHLVRGDQGGVREEKELQYIVDAKYGRLETHGALAVAHLNVPAGERAVRDGERAGVN